MRVRVGSWGLRGARLLCSIGLAIGLGNSAAAQLVVDPGTVIQTIQTSLWNPPSPDPAGITYRPDTGELLTCDSEVEETVQGITLYQGVNIWAHSRTGVVSSTYTSVGFSNEPTGISFDPAGGRLWISDDVRHSIFEIDFGPDGLFRTGDDVIKELRNYSSGCVDVEDVTYNNFDGHLYVPSGSQQICKIGVGANAIFDGAPPQGDDVVTTIDVPGGGFLDPEGIVYDPFWNTLVIADRATRDLYEITPAGGILRKIDVNFPGSTKPSGVTIAPGTTNPALRNYFVTDRRVDNDSDPLENDGRIYEVVAIPLGGNGAPIVDAGPPQTIQWPTNSVDLDGFVSDDGHPYPPSTVLALWGKQSGPGTVNFGDPNNPVTGASFSAPGSYVLQLVGNDSALNTLDTVEITLSQTVTLSAVTSGPGTVTLDPPGGSYSFGQDVTVTAVPDPGAGFTGWSGDLAGTGNPQVLGMDADKSVTASFVTLVNLDVTTDGPGSVDLSPPGGSYLPGTDVTLSALPGANAVFSGWGGALSGSTNPEALTVNANTSVSASFTQLYSVSPSAIGPGSVMLAPPIGPYASGTNVVVTAAPDLGAVFVGWGGALSGATNPANLLVDGDKTVSASFEPASFSLTLNKSGQGMVSASPPTGPYPAGSFVTLTASPGSGLTFGGWTGDATGNASPLQLLMDGDKTVHAQFHKNPGGGGGCGVGPELALLVPMLSALRRRRRTGNSAVN